MKKFFIIICSAVLLFIGNTMQAQTSKSVDTTKKGYIFTDIKRLPISSIKDQNNAGTCWCYSGLAYIESELLRMGKPEYDFSEMYIIYHTYLDRAKAAVRTHGDISFSQGGAFNDVFYAMKTYGLVPDAEMPAGKMYGDTLSDHTELSAVTDPYVAAIAKGSLKKIQHDKDGNPLWIKGLEGVYNAYLGTPPDKFTYNGVQYTPMSFYQSLGINPDDYVSLTSYSHHPFYEKFILEIQDNWRWAQSYNLPIDELMQVMDNAIATGYTVAWGADVSEKGWLRGENAGIAVLPDLDGKNVDKTNSDMAHWIGLSATDRQKEAMNQPTPQKWVTQEERQTAYDDWETTDDHGMQIFGTAKDQLGNEYYIVKNSWGKYGKFDGIVYVSKAFVRYKTMNIIVHKDAIPKDIKKKLGIK